jgi:protein-tyrosine phosphatase
MSEGRPFLVLHVCTGNICRSPMAELLMRDRLDTTYGSLAAGVVLDGAGTYAGHNGELINGPAGVVLGELGVDASAHRAQGLTRAAAEHADLVLCATRDHVREVVSRVPAAADRTFTLRQLAAVAAVADAAGLEPTDDPAVRLATLRDLAPHHPAVPPREADIEDPYGLPLDVYRATATQIRSAVRSVIGAPTPAG